MPPKTSPDFLKLVTLADDRVQQTRSINSELRLALDSVTARNEQLFADVADQINRRIILIEQNQGLVKQLAESYHKQNELMRKNVELLEEIERLKEWIGDFIDRHGHIEGLAESLQGSAEELSYHTEAVISLIETLNEKDKALDESIKHIEDRQEEQANALAACTCGKVNS